MAALLGGQVDMYFGNASEIVPAAGNSAIRILGVATDTRMRQLPQIPTVSEFYPDFALSAWNGFMVPAKTPREIVDKLAAQVIAAAHDPPGSPTSASRRTAPRPTPSPRRSRASSRSSTSRSKRRSWGSIEVTLPTSS
jgi:tripartite-type tricarboxylate transporter receptor subunit TctC